MCYVERFAEHGSSSSKTYESPCLMWAEPDGGECGRVDGVGVEVLRCGWWCGWLCVGLCHCGLGCITSGSVGRCAAMLWRVGRARQQQECRHQCHSYDEQWQQCAAVGTCEWLQAHSLSTCDTTRAARSMNAIPSAEAGLRAAGLPWSPWSQMDCTSGICASNGTPSSSASCRQPSRPKM